MALVGYVDAISRSGVEGWAVDTDQAGVPAEIAVLVNGQQRAAGRADQPRRGLAAATKGAATDQSGFVVAFDPPLSAFEEFRIEVVEPATRTRLPGGAQTLPRPGRELGAPLTPLLVTSTGDAAITNLIGELSRHPAIVVAERPPYETRQIGYHAQAFSALTAAAGPPRELPPDSVLAAIPPTFTAANPGNSPNFHNLAKPRTLLRDFYERRIPARYAALFGETIAEFYEIVRLGQSKAAALYFLERSDLDDDARQAARLFFPRVRELVVVRDPRDVLALATAYFQLPEISSLAALRPAVARLWQIQKARAPDTLIVRHEDLVLEPVSTRKAIGSFLDLDLPLPEATSPPDGDDPAGLIGRWRRELSSDQVALCEAEFGDFMAIFDYRQTDTGISPRPEKISPQITPAPAPLLSPPPVVHPPVLAGVLAYAGPAQAGQAAIAPGRLGTAAEGAAAVAALRAVGTQFAADGREMIPVARLEFGRGNAGAAQLGPGWSQPEPGYVWSNARQAHLAMPPLREAGTYRVWLAGAPMINTDKLSEQRITVLVNTTEVGTVTLREPAVLAFDLPVVGGNAGGKIAVVFRLPDAARPCDLGNSSDDRLLGFSLRWAVILRMEQSTT